MPDTNTANPPTPLLTESEQAWLDATPFGERRELTSCGRTFAVDRRFGSSPAPHVPSPQPAVVPTPFYIGDVIANPPSTGDSGIAPMTVTPMPTEVPTSLLTSEVTVNESTSDPAAALRDMFGLQAERLLGGHHDHPRCDRSLAGRRA